MFIQIVFVSLLQLVLGLVLCFAGFRLFVLVLPVFSFFAGFLVTAQAIQQLFGGGFLATTSSWVFGFVIGVLCAVAAYFVYYAAVAVLAVTAGYELGVGLMTGLGANLGFLLFLVGLIVAVAVVAVVIVLNLPKVLIVALTAEAGASMIVTGILLALGKVSLAALQWGLVGAVIRASWFWSLVIVVLALAGIAVQLLLPEAYSLEPYRLVRTSPPVPDTPVAAPPPRGAEPAV